ncbi:hypothetical protein AB0M36_12715 [Actinoplanes sp. NPDC051346]|uniref:hypothetical protein n=1 Tax=Actinoplanes sp. NPDC051346 TaxID=3155048 RepID=UPI0034331372
MRRTTVLAGFVLAALWIAAPAQAFAHNAVHNASLHALLDGLTLAVASAPVWTALLWRGPRRLAFAALIALVQVPVAVIGFVPIVDPYLHLALFVLALSLTGVSLHLARRGAVSAPAPARDRR